VRFDKLDDLDCSLMNIIHIFTVRVLAEEGGGSDDDVSVSQQVISKHLGYWKKLGNPHSVNACLNRNPGIVHMTTDVRQDLYFE